MGGNKGKQTLADFVYSVAVSEADPREETEDCQNLRQESLIIVDLKYVEISILAILNIK